MDDKMVPRKVGLAAANQAREWSLNPHNKYLLEALDNKEIKHTYLLTLRQLRRRRGDLNESIPFVHFWARGNHDTYCDIMKSLAVLFMPFEMRPKAMFVACGLNDTGRSEYLDLVEMIAGHGNCSRLSIDEVTKVRTASRAGTKIQNDREKLLMSLVNISDSEVRNTRIPRQNELCDILNGNSPFRCTFYASMFDQPVWDIAFYQALGDATIVLPFPDHPKTESQNQAPYHFAITNYTPKTITRLIGEVLALARYFTKDAPLFFSERGLRLRHSPKYFAGNFNIYMSLFTKHFCGYANKSQVHRDYVKWCELRETTPLPVKQVYKLLDEHKVAWSKKLLNTPQGRTPENEGGKYTRFWKFTGSPSGDRLIYTYDEYIPQLKSTLGKYATRKSNGLRLIDTSLVHALENTTPFQDKNYRRSRQRHFDHLDDEMPFGYRPK